MSSFNIPGDIALAADGRRFLFWQGPEEVAERLRTALQIVRGLWRFNTTIGIRYLYEILEKPAAIDLLRAECYRIISHTPGIVSVSSVVVVYDRETRTARVDFEARSNVGAVTSYVEFS